jgi:hypothetical protein
MDELTFKTEQHPVSHRWAVFEESDAAAYLYLTVPDERGEGPAREMQDAWVYNRIPPPDVSELPQFHGDAPPVCDGYVLPSAPVHQDPVGAENVAFLWSEDGEAVAVAVLGVYQAFNVPSVERGFSRDLACDSPWGHPFDEVLFQQAFSRSEVL